MQNDEVIWQVIRHNHCSFMAKIETGIFCRNPYNVTGLCNRSSCPLANSRYATIREHDGVFYLYMKTIERAHMPSKLWERVKMPKNYEKALEIIDKHMMYWPKFLVHKIKQRLTKMTQMRIRMRKLALKTREKIMTTPRKQAKREIRREEKALKAAELEKKIEEELLRRLRDGIHKPYEIFNLDYDKFTGVLDRKQEGVVDEEEEEEEEGVVEYVEDDGNFEEEDDIEDFNGLAIGESLTGDDYDDVDEDGEDNDDEYEMDAIDRGRVRRGSVPSVRKSGKEHDRAKKKPRVLVEVEDEGLAGKRQTSVQ